MDRGAPRNDGWGQRANGFFITGTDTEVGKTVVTAALAFLLRQRGIQVGVMKPVATGCLRENGSLRCQDAEQLLRAAGAAGPIDWVCPYRFEPPVAPWVALRQSTIHDPRLPSAATGGQAQSTIRSISLKRIEDAYRRLKARHDFMLVEGIGGLLVPLDGRHTVADLARRLGLPIILVARAGLGTINHTLLTLEAARRAELDVVGVVLNRRSGKGQGSLAEATNPEVIRRWGGVPILGIVPEMAAPTPKKVSRFLEGVRPLQAHIQGSDPWICPQRGLTPQVLARIDRRRLWHPFTQMSEWEKEEPLIVESAGGVWLTDVRGKRYLDGVSSLWVNLHGHRHPALDRALKVQIGKVAHSTLLGAANVPSILLAEALVRIAPPGLTRVFYSDNGSTAVEVALKMAFQYWQQNSRPQKSRFVHFVNAYHGDTIGSVSVGGIDLFHKVYRTLLFRGFKVPAPYPYRGVRGEDSLRALRKTLERHHRQIAGVVVEPLVQGAAGMMVQPRGWLKQVEQLCRRYDAFLIADEVAVGFGRTGTMFACEQEKVWPDFLCLAKGLTGGYLPMAATLTTERIYRGFLGPYASRRTFFHGHSYTGNPLACAVALENLAVFRRERLLAKVQPKIRLFSRALKRLESLPHVGQVRQQGLMAGIELVRDKKAKRPYPWEEKVGIRVCQQLRRRGILLRPLGNVVVLMPPLAISAGEIRLLCRETCEAIGKVTG